MKKKYDKKQKGKDFALDYNNKYIGLQISSLKLDEVQTLKFEYLSEGHFRALSQRQITKEHYASAVSVVKTGDYTYFNVRSNEICQDLQRKTINDVAMGKIKFLLITGADINHKNSDALVNIMKVNMLDLFTELGGNTLKSQDVIVNKAAPHAWLPSLDSSQQNSSNKQLFEKIDSSKFPSLGTNSKNSSSTNTTWSSAVTGQNSSKKKLIKKSPQENKYENMSMDEIKDLEFEKLGDEDFKMLSTKIQIDKEHYQSAVEELKKKGDDYYKVNRYLHKLCESFVLEEEAVAIGRIKLLLLKGTDVNYTVKADGYGHPYSYTILSDVIETNCDELIDLFLKLGSDINPQVENMWRTPLTSAAVTAVINQKSKIFYTMIEHQDAANWVNPSNSTISPLSQIFTYYYPDKWQKENLERVAKKLINKGANLNSDIKYRGSQSGSEESAKKSLMEIAQVHNGDLFNKLVKEYPIAKELAGNLGVSINNSLWQQATQFEEVTPQTVEPVDSPLRASLLTTTKATNQSTFYIPEPLTSFHNVDTVNAPAVDVVIVGEPEVSSYWNIMDPTS